MLWTQDPLDAAVMVFVLAIAIIDWRTHRIPNLLCMVSLIIGLVLQIYAHGTDGLVSALSGAAIGFAMFLPFYALRAFGAGDVKAMATVGIFLGMSTTILAVGVTLIVGALIGVAVLLLRPIQVTATIHRLVGMFSSPIATVRNSRDDTNKVALRFPYGVAIACGTAAALLITSN